MGYYVEKVQECRDGPTVFKVWKKGKQIGGKYKTIEEAELSMANDFTYPKVFDSWSYDDDGKMLPPL